MTKAELGWGAKAISEIASRCYDGFVGMFEKHGWPERGQNRMPKVQARVKDEYGSIAAFLAKHEGMA